MNGRADPERTDAPILPVQTNVSHFRFSKPTVPPFNFPVWQRESDSTRHKDTVNILTVGTRSICLKLESTGCRSLPGGICIHNAVEPEIKSSSESLRLSAENALMLRGEWLLGVCGWMPTTRCFVPSAVEIAVVTSERMVK